MSTLHVWRYMEKIEINIDSTVEDGVFVRMNSECEKYRDIVEGVVENAVALGYAERDGNTVLIDPRIRKALRVVGFDLILGGLFSLDYCTTGGVEKKTFARLQFGIWDIKELHEAGKIQLEIRVNGRLSKMRLRQRKWEEGMTSKQKIIRVKNSYRRKLKCPVRAKMTRFDTGYISICCVCSSEKRTLLNG